MPLINFVTVKDEHKAVKLTSGTDENANIVQTSEASMTHTEVKQNSANIYTLEIPPPPPQPVKGKEAKAISSYLVKDNVLTAEVLWALKTVLSHYSCSSSDNNDKLFQRMFPDSQIAADYASGKTKCSYLIKFGLVPYFHQKVVNIISNKTCIYSVSFDESFNKVLQQEQMDLVLRFWDDSKQQVVSQYYDSTFLGHTRAEDLLEKFQNAVATLDSSNMLQISMDGPSTNWKFLDQLIKLGRTATLTYLIF